jgi:hypothetical protein
LDGGIRPLRGAKERLKKSGTKWLDKYFIENFDHADATILEKDKYFLRPPLSRFSADRGMAKSQPQNAVENSRKGIRDDFSAGACGGHRHSRRIHRVILSYGFGSDGHGNADAALSGKLACDFAVKRGRPEAWQCEYKVSTSRNSDAVSDFSILR